jgi:hypothetical protein
MMAPAITPPASPPTTPPQFWALACELAIENIIKKAHPPRNLNLGMTSLLQHQLLFDLLKQQQEHFSLIGIF